MSSFGCYLQAGHWAHSSTTGKHRTEIRGINSLSTVYNRTRTIAAGGEGGFVLYGFVPVGEKEGSRTQLRTRCGVEVLLDLFGGGGGRSQSSVVVPGCRNSCNSREAGATEGKWGNGTMFTSL